MPEGPFALLLKSISKVQNEFKGKEQHRPIRTALITARNSPAHERVIRTLAEWGVMVDEVHFMGGVHKHEVLEAFRADIFLMIRMCIARQLQTLFQPLRYPIKINLTQRSKWTSIPLSSIGAF